MQHLASVPVCISDVGLHTALMVPSRTVMVFLLVHFHRDAMGLHLIIHLGCSRYNMYNLTPCFLARLLLVLKRMRTEDHKVEYRSIGNLKDLEGRGSKENERKKERTERDIHTYI